MGLTKRQIDRASYDPDGPAQQIVYDDDIPGFGVRLYPSGGKSFVVRYRTPSGRSRYLTVGRYGVLTLAQARKKARKALVQAADGQDPAQARQEARGAVTVAEFAETYMERHSKPHKRTWREDRRRIDSYIKPAIGTVPLHEVTTGELSALHAEIGKSAKVEANRVLELFRAIFNKAITWGAVPKATPNPASDFDKFAEQSRDRWVRPSEMPALVKAVEAEENVYIRAAIWLLLLTGCRRSEILRAKWQDVDWDRRELRIPETKAGPARTVPLSEPALSVLEEIPRQRNNAWIICGAHKGKRLKGFAKAWRRIRKAADLEDVTIHDLRRTVGSWMATAGVSLHIVGDVLGHQDHTATRIYARLAEEAPRKALATYAEELLTVANGEGVEEAERA